MSAHITQDATQKRTLLRGQEERESLARQLREPHKTRLLCIHRIRRNGYCTECGAPTGRA